MNRRDFLKGVSTLPLLGNLPGAPEPPVTVEPPRPVDPPRFQPQSGQIVTAWSFTCLAPIESGVEPGPFAVDCWKALE